MKIILVVAALIFSGMAQAQQSMNYEDSPMNFKNSEANFNNSSQNYNNSPQNFNNSSTNYNAPNATYDSRGNRTGYEVLSPEGVLNRFGTKVVLLKRLLRSFVGEILDGIRLMRIPC